METLKLSLRLSTRSRAAPARDGRFDLRVLVLGHELHAALLLDLVRRCAGWDFAAHLRLRSGEPAEPDYRRHGDRSQ